MAGRFPLKGATAEAAASSADPSNIDPPSLQRVDLEVDLNRDTEHGYTREERTYRHRHRRGATPRRPRGRRIAAAAAKAQIEAAVADAIDKG